MNSLSIKCAGEDLVILPDKAIYWERKSTLIVADTHFGKSASFRSFGIAAPENTLEDVQRLSMLLDHTKSKRLVILGDFLHARSGRTEATMNELATWCKTLGATKIHLVSGNHDLAAGKPPPGWCIETAGASMEDPPFTYCHVPRCQSKTYVLSGHLHPAVTLVGKFGGGLKAPCFVFGKERAIFPAFGSFTGTKSYKPEVGDRFYAVGQGEVIPLPMAK